MTPAAPIVILDSGLGGLTVVRALRRALPPEDLVYFGDTAHLPYGSKSAATVSAFVRRIIEYLLPMRPKHVVIACNTATALALPAARAAFPGLTITGVIDPGAKAAAVAAGSKRVPVIGILATEATIKSKAYERAILRRRNHARLLLRAAPLLVPIIEDGRRGDDALVRVALRQYLDPLLSQSLDVLVLGCTHYPILKDTVRDMVGPHVRVIDSADQCADDVAARLTSARLLRGEPLSIEELADEPARRPTNLTGGVPEIFDTLDDRAGGSLRCYVTDDAPRFAGLASRFLGGPIETPTLVSPEALLNARGPAIALRRPA